MAGVDGQQQHSAHSAGMTGRPVFCGSRIIEQVFVDRRMQTVWVLSSHCCLVPFESRQFVPIEILACL